MKFKTKKKKEKPIRKEDIKDLDLMINEYKSYMKGRWAPFDKSNIWHIGSLLEKGIITKEDIWDDKRIIEFSNKMDTLKDPITKEELINSIGMTNEEFNGIIDSYRLYLLKEIDSLDDFTIYFVKTLLRRRILTELEIYLKDEAQDL